LQSKNKLITTQLRVSLSHSHAGHLQRFADKKQFKTTNASGEGMRQALEKTQSEL